MPHDWTFEPWEPPPPGGAAPVWGWAALRAGAAGGGATARDRRDPPRPVLARRLAADVLRPEGALKRRGRSSLACNHRPHHRPHLPSPSSCRCTTPSAYVREAVESILAQTFTDFEFIIFDDGSTDRSPLILRELAARDPRIRLTVRPNKGLTKTLNEALALAPANLIARMDCDDVALPERLATQVEFLRRRDDVVCAGGYWQLIDGAGRLLTTIRPPTDDAEMQQLLLKGHSPLCHPLATFRREAVMKLGGYDETFTTAQDVDLWLRLGEVGKLANVPEVLLKFRLHESSVSETRRLEQRRLSKLACERRGSAAGSLERSRPTSPGGRAATGSRATATPCCTGGGRSTAASAARRRSTHLRQSAACRWTARGWVLLASAAIKGNAGGVIDFHGGASGAAATPPAGAALSEPVVTVIMAMRNAERYVADSARSVLCQEGVDLELVVVDDGSTDRSRAVVEQIAKEDPRLRIVDGPRAGIAMAVNAGLAAAKGEFVSRCDSDDLYPADRLRRQVQWLKSHADFGAVSGSFETIDARGRFVMAMRTGDEPAEITDELAPARLGPIFRPS